MPSIIGVNEFTDIPLLERGVPVEGGEEGSSNAQGKAIANRTEFLRQLIGSILGNSVINVNGQTGKVLLSAADVNAEPSGTAMRTLDNFLSGDDPIPQYLKITVADETFIKADSANQPLGFLQLDSQGKLPASVLETMVSRYSVVPDQPARLALPQIEDLSICVQTDVDQLFYLNAGDDPADANNWLAGQSTDSIGVLRVFGRAGDIQAEAGDYTADQITETTNRKFVSPDEKTAWGGKQAPLVSGQNIRTLNGQSLLGSGDIEVDAAAVGAAEAQHTHSTDDVQGLSQLIASKLQSSFKPGAGITLAYDPVSGETTVSTRQGDENKSYVVVDRPSAIAGQIYSYYFANQFNFQLDGYALKEIPQASDATAMIDDFTPVSSVNYASSKDIMFDGSLKAYQGKPYTLTAVGDGTYQSVIRVDGKEVVIKTQPDYVVPVMTGNSAPAGYTAAASGSYDATRQPWRAFDRNAAAWSSGDVWWSPDNSIPNAWLRIGLPTARTITQYRIGLRTDTAAAAPNKGIPLSFRLEGTNDITGTWNVLDTQTDVPWTDTVLVKTFTLNAPATYKFYRLFFTKTSSTNGGVGVSNFDILGAPPVVIKDKNGDYYTAANGVLTKIDALQFDRGFGDSGVIDSSKFDGLQPIQIFAQSAVPVNVYYRPQPQIAVPTTVTFAGIWSRIKKANMAATQTGNGKVRVAVSRDGQEWFSWILGAWTSMGALGTDTASAAKLIAQGNTPAALNDRSEGEWSVLYQDHNFVPDRIAFAFAVDITDPIADVATIESLQLNVGLASKWIKQSADSVEICWYPNGVSFTPKDAGNYKFGYQIP